MDQRAGPKKQPLWVWALVIALIIVLVLIIIAVPRVHEYEDLLSGFWVGDPVFLKKADLSDMYLFVAPREDGSRQGYLVMVDNDGNFVSNQGLEISYCSTAGRWWSAIKSNFCAMSGRASSCLYRIPRVSIDYDDKAVMPTDVKIALSVAEGTLTIYDDEKVYAFFYRDNQASASSTDGYAKLSGLDEEDT